MQGSSSRYQQHLKGNKQDFLQVFQGSGIGEIEDNLTSADPPSYTTNESIPRRPGELGQRLLPLTLVTPTPQLPVELWIINIDRQTGKQFIIKGTYLARIKIYSKINQDISIVSLTLVIPSGEAFIICGVVSCVTNTF